MKTSQNLIELVRGVENWRQRIKERKIERNDLRYSEELWTEGQILKRKVDID